MPRALLQALTALSLQGSNAHGTYVVLGQLVNGHLGIMQVAVEGDNLMAHRALLFLIVLALGHRDRGRRGQWLVPKPSCWAKAFVSPAAVDERSLKS